MIILGLDMASKTGWCIYDTEAGRVIESGVQEFALKRGESNGGRFLRFRAWLKQITGFLPPIEFIAYEQAHLRGGPASELCVGFQTRAQEIAAELGIESAPVHTGTLKKHATGSGSASKGDMIKAAEKHLGRKPLDDNEADSVLIAAWAAETYGG